MAARQDSVQAKPALDLVGLFKFNDTTIHDDFVEHTSYNNLGPQLERWSVVRQIARGSSSTVWLYRETHQPGKRLRAVKVIPKDRREYYKSEIAALAKFSKYRHAYVFFHGWYETRNEVFLAQEFFELGDLGKYINAPFPEHRVKSIASQLLDGISILHSENFVHRDLSPKNILVASINPYWNVKIGDFGLAKRVQRDDGQMMTVVGTPAYQAPEINRFFESTDAIHNYTAVVDIWSLGCIFYELLTGVRPFGWDPRTVKQYCQGILPFPVNPLVMVDISKEGISVLEKFLEVLPENRITAQEGLKSAWICGNEAIEKPLRHLEAQDQSKLREQAVVEFFKIKEFDITVEKHMTLALLEAAAEGLQDVACEAIENGAVLEKQSKNGMRPLHYAAANGHTAMVGLLLANGARIDAEDKNMMQPLHHAAKNGNMAIASILLAQGAEFEAPSENGMQPLHFAAANGCADVLGLLLDNGANFECEDRRKRRPVHHAAIHGHKAIFDHLLTVKANFEPTDEDIMRPIQYATKYGHKEVAEVLLENNAEPNVPSHYGMQPIHYAMLHKNLDVFRVLLSKGANVEAEDPAGSRLIHLAVSSRRKEMIQCLVGKDVDMMALDAERNTPLHLAIRAGSDCMTKLVLENGGFSELQNADGATAFDLALKIGHQLAFPGQGDDISIFGPKRQHEKIHSSLASQTNGNYTLASLLLRYGANVDGNTRPTPLQDAVRSGDEELVDLLLSYKPNTELTDTTTKETPLQLSTIIGDNRITKKLLEYGTNVNVKGRSNLRTPLQYCLFRNNLEAGELLLKHGAEKDVSDPDTNKTILQQAVEQRRTDFIALLLAHGADANGSKASAGEAPLFTAVDKEEAGIAKLLVYGGANTEVESIESHRTVLCLAAKKGDVVMTRILLEAKAKVNHVCSGSGHTALHYAILAGHVEVARLLLNHGANIWMKDKTGKDSSQLNATVNFKMTDAYKPIQQLLNSKGGSEKISTDLRLGRLWCWHCFYESLAGICCIIFFLSAVSIAVLGLVHFGVKNLPFGLVQSLVPPGAIGGFSLIANVTVNTWWGNTKNERVWVMSPRGHWYTA